MTEQVTAGILNLQVKHIYKNEEQQFVVPVDEIGLTSIDHESLDVLNTLSLEDENIIVSYEVTPVKSFEAAREKLENGYNLTLPENFNVFVADEYVLGEEHPVLVSRNIISSMMNHVRDAIIDKGALGLFDALRESIANIEELFYC
jgi:hypothetical protein